MRVLSSAATLKVKDGTLDFNSRSFDGLAGFLRQGAREFLLALGHERGDLAKNALALEGGQTAGGAEGFDGGGDGGFGVLFAALRDAGDQAAIVGGADFYQVAVLLPTSVHEEAVRRNRRDRHLCHFCLAPRETTFAIIGLLIG